MTREEKIKLADDLIKEDDNCRIRDYLEVVKEIELVEASPTGFAPSLALTPKEREVFRRSSVVKRKRGRPWKRGLKLSKWGVEWRGTIHLSLIENTEQNA